VEILPCPHCGIKGDIGWESGWDVDADELVHYLVCWICGVGGPTAKTEDQAILLWNALKRI
jgi:hypothetical protein